VMAVLSYGLVSFVRLTVLAISSKGVQCPNFVSVTAARLTGQPLDEAHPH